MLFDPIKIDFHKFKIWFSPIKWIGYVAFLPFAFMTAYLKVLIAFFSIGDKGYLYVWYGLSLFLVFGCLFYYLIAPSIINNWDSKKARHAFRPYILGGMVIFALIILFVLLKAF